MKGIQKCLALFLMLAMAVGLLAGCAEEKVPEGEKIEEPTETARETQAAVPEATETESESEPVDTRSFLEKEKENDPILLWEDPFTEEEMEEWEKAYFSEPESDKTEEEYNEYHDYVRMRALHYMAVTNYPVYYYYFSGRSEYKEGYTKDNPNYDTLSLTADYRVPESFVLNMLADACVKVRIKEAFEVTIERTYQDDEEREKMEAMGEEPTYEAWNLTFTVDECYWGDMNGDEEIFIFPRVMSEEFIEILRDPDKTFVMFLWRHEDTGAYNHTGLPEYGTLVRGVFDYTDGQLRTYSNLEDVAAYNGMTAEEMIETGVEQAEKYKELLDYVRGD